MPGQAPAGSPSPASAVNRPDPSPSAREQQQATRTKHLTNHPSDREKAPLPLSSQLLSRAPNERSLPVSGTVPPQLNVIPGPKSWHHPRLALPSSVAGGVFAPRS